MFNIFVNPDGTIYKTVTGEAMTLCILDAIPVRPAIDLQPRQYQEMVMVDGVPTWVIKERPMTEIEQLQQRNAELEVAIVELAGIVGGGE